MECQEQVQKLLNYLRDGGTWLRLQAIAVQPLHDGGLALTTESSVTVKKMFANAPPTILDGRPDIRSVLVN